MEYCIDRSNWRLAVVDVCVLNHFFVGSSGVLDFAEHRLPRAANPGTKHPVSTSIEQFIYLIVCTKHIFLLKVTDMTDLGLFV